MGTVPVSAQADFHQGLLTDLIFWDYVTDNGITLLTI
jgi:hypothetical protein